ncbi:type II toxin-antitoxin system RelE/ParE family toxin [Pseudomonas sp. FEN]|uniref:type II toxin-antitoxin system RelE/ParE family toxin n=1 Tax=Pseudomonas sp. FEN TaxID=2767468 RepID=UPI00174DA567|nr:type II toxin-antitoxin system RelE/ParE family toxin [Pseudomonas sp. FEN]
MLVREIKPIEFCGTSKKVIGAFPDGAKQRVAYELESLQEGEEASDWKPMKSVGPGVNEIRVKCKDGAFRVFYVVNRPEAIYVLHAFRKTTEKTEKRDIDLAKARFKSLG